VREPKCNLEIATTQQHVLIVDLDDNDLEPRTYSQEELINVAIAKALRLLGSLPLGDDVVPHAQYHAPTPEIPYYAVRLDWTTITKSMREAGE
jgi:hypothetical protein